MYHTGAFSPEPNASNVIRLLRAMCSTNSTCILGAGAEMPTIPSPAGMNRRVLRRVIEMTDCIVPGKLGAANDRNWLKPLGYESSAFVNMAIRQLTPQALRLFEYGETTPPSLLSAPVQYAVFKAFSTDLAIINLNTSSMAERFCPQTTIWSPHGGLKSGFPHGCDEELLFDMASAGHDVAPSSQHYFEAEPPGFYGYLEALWASYLLSGREDIVLIGYSFAKWGNRLNDAEFYRLFTAIVSCSPARITIVDPNGHELVARMTNDLGLRDVVCVPAYWNHLADSILNTIQQSPIQPNQIEVIAGDVIYRYFNLLNCDHRNIWRKIEQLADWRDRRAISGAQFEAGRNELMSRLSN